ncbi:MAG TPA: methyl-accepting chemotaxis protein [Patescibacteria group bacterium]|nr:methyl-accepting chemotaxis protein [Patescibacteria group bacterium]
MKSLKAQLLATIIPLIVFVLGGVIITAYWNTSSLLRSNLEDKFQLQAQALAKSFDVQLQREKTVMIALGKQGTFLFPSIVNDREKQLDFVKRMHDDFPQWNPVTFFPDISGTVAVTSLGRVVDASKLDYVKLIPAGQPFIADPIVSIVNNKAIIVGGAPISIGGKVVGSVTGGMLLEQFTKEIDELKIGQSGYAILVSPTGTLVSHPNKELVMKQKIESLNIPALSQTMAEIRKGQAGRILTTVNGVEQIIAYAPTQDGWGVFVAVPTREQFAAIDRLQWVFGIMFLVALLIALLVINKLADRIVRPIHEAAQYVQVISDGDFTEETLAKTNLAQINSQDEIGQLSRAIRKMRSDLWSVLKLVSTSADQVSGASEELRLAAKESSQTAQQVTSSVLKVASGTRHQTDVMSNCSGNVDNLAASAHQIAANTAKAANASTEANKAASSGGQAISDAVRQMSHIEDTVSKSATVVTTLGERSKEIGQIIDTISNIAGQTNLLALNAAIEAARAGEQGRGFAVVADEVRRLAEQSQEAAKQIAALIGEIQSETDKAVDAMTSGNREVKRGSETVTSAGQAFQQIVNAIEQVSGEINTISTATQQMANGSQNIVTAMHEVISVNQNAASETETVSAAAEEQSATMEEMAASCDELRRLAIELKESLQKFRI